MAQEYWKWPESDWVADTIDWQKSKKITAGVDIGTTSSQAVILCDGDIFGYANIYTGSDFAAAAEEVLRRATGASGMSRVNIHGIAATGFGRKNVTYADKEIGEIECHARGARFIFGPSVMTVVDLGGQNTKAIRLFDWDRIRQFQMNDKCAIGMGRNIETICRILQVPLADAGELSLQVDCDSEPVSTTCYNFADSETIGLLRQGYKEESYDESEVLGTYFFAIAWRILGTIGKLQPLDVGDITAYKEIAFTGGLAKNKGVTKRIERELKITALGSETDPQLAGAIGAALLI
jgi:predicted CoA-substrate-specific enzyme activase